MKKYEGLIKFSKGSVFVSINGPCATKSLQPVASIVSIGTELRQLRMSKTCSDIFAGYMNIVSTDTKHFFLVPSPHGSSNEEAINDARVLKFPKDIPLYYIAAARFQLITAVNIKNMKMTFERNTNLLILGSGPVSVGAFFEAVRLEINNIFVQPELYKTLYSFFPQCQKLNDQVFNSFDVVFDCKGQPDESVKYVKDEGVIAIIGTPCKGMYVDALSIHRRGIKMYGFHELIPPPSLYLRIFRFIVKWITNSVDSELLKSLTIYMPGYEAREVYHNLCRYPRKYPFIIFKW
ncbi:hypothetical protein RBJ15_11385 [Pantoea sp. BS_4]|uniref:hypothetical protein n=1 Tax=unclassified Pantoea TaxID=2630326 RepID=UPI0035BFCF49